MGFGYNPVDFDHAEDVKLVSKHRSSNEQEFDSQDDLTEGQRKKRTIVNFHREKFEQFESYLGDLLSCYSEFGVDRGRIADLVGAPDFIACENCGQLREDRNGNSVCNATGEGINDRKHISDPHTIPPFCTRDMRCYITAAVATVARPNERVREYCSNQSRRGQRRAERAHTSAPTCTTPT